MYYNGASQIYSYLNKIIFVASNLYNRAPEYSKTGWIGNLYFTGLHRRTDPAVHVSVIGRRPEEHRIYL